MKLKIIFLFTVMLCMSLAVCAQSNATIEYQYDASGNRILRQLVQQRSNQSPRQQQTTFMVYPTIVTDVLYVTTQDEIAPNEFHYSITNVSGNIVLSGYIQSQNNQLQVSLPQGYYIINIFSNTEQQSFNFLKN